MYLEDYPVLYDLRQILAIEVILRFFREFVEISRIFEFFELRRKTDGKRFDIRLVHFFPLYDIGTKTGRA